MLELLVLRKFCSIKVGIVNFTSKDDLLELWPHHVETDSRDVDAWELVAHIGHHVYVKTCLEVWL